MPLKKIGRAIKKTVRKVVPKELAGIMQVAAPFTGAAAPFVYAAGSLKQTGRINPIVAASLAAPYLRFGGDQAFRYGSAQAGDFGIRNLLFGGRGVEKSLFDPKGFGGTADKFLFGSPATEDSFGVAPSGTESGEITFPISGDEATRGILGAEGKFDLKQSKLIRSGGVGDNKLNKTNIAALVAGGASLLTTKEEVLEEGEEAGLEPSEIARLQAEAEEIWRDFNTTAFRPKITAAIGGLMRKNLAAGTVNPFKPKPEDFGIEDNELPADPKPFRPKPNVGDKAEGILSFEEYFEGKRQFMKDQTIEDMIEEYENYLRKMSMKRDMVAKGGLMRENYALGTKPTKEESGLGGLPIEADMRYTGGFMPYGAKEKADDVPARLSKNEFVFTADAVRAAGGGSVQKGAQRMYNTMKQLESMGKMA
mgnify:CR=1 FL=1